MSNQPDTSSGRDIYQLLLGASERQKKERRAQLLQPLNIQEFFEDGSITIDMTVCKGVECKLCIDVCPTNALYWKAGEVGIVEDLCIHCTACVLNCIVDDCIKVSRERASGEVEKFSDLKTVLQLLHKISGRHRKERVKTRKEWRRDVPPLPKKHRRHFHRFRTF